MDENIGINRVIEKRCQSVPKEENSINSQKQLVSIIVPVYNAEHVLNRCIKSLLNQTYYELEVVVIVV